MNIITVSQSININNPLMRLYRIGQRWNRPVNMAYGVSNKAYTRFCEFMVQNYKTKNNKALTMCIVPGTCCMLYREGVLLHDDVIKWKHFLRYWPYVRGIQRPPVKSTHKGQWRRALMFSLICAWTNGWIYNRNAGDLRRRRAHYGVTVMGDVSIKGQKRLGRF